jgi:hypothetical protein
MPIGITRAQDRVAIWHEAASDPWTDPKPPKPDKDTWVDPPKASTSKPPAGAPEPKSLKPSVQVTKSKKFLTPTNNLKKLLDTIEPDDNSHGAGAHPGVKQWIDNHPAFAKTYFKPQYKNQLVTALGTPAYTKLVYHMPKEHHHALHNVAQSPAPKSNKFLPAGQLKTLLDSPNTTPEHVKSFIDTHPAFAKTYLHNPAYQDAIKGALGEQNYTDWQEHLTGPHHNQYTDQADLKKKPTKKWVGPGPDPTVPTVKGGPSWQDEIDKVKAEKPIANPFTELLKNQPAPEDADEIDAIKQEMPKGLGDKLKAAVPSFDSGTWNKLHQSNPAVAQDTLKKYLDTLSQTAEGTPEKIKAVQQIYDKHFAKGGLSFADQVEAEKIKQEMPAPGQSGFAPEMHGKALQDIKGILHGSGYGDEVPMGKFLNGLDSDEAVELAKPHNGLAATQAYEKWMEDQGGQAPDDQDEINQIQQLLHEPNEPSTKAPTAQHDALVAGIKKIFPNTPLDLDSMSTPELKGQLENWQKHLDHPDLASHLDQVNALHEQHFGQGAQQPAAPTELSVGAQLTAIPGYPTTGPSAESLDTSLSKKTPEKIKELFDNTAEGHPEMAEALKKLYDQNYGQGAQPQATPPKSFGEMAHDIWPYLNAEKFDEQTPEAQQQYLKGWQVSATPEQQAALDDIEKTHFGGGAAPEPSGPDHYQDLLDKINAVSPGWIKQKSWLEVQDKANGLQKAIQGWAQNGDLSPEEQAGFQNLHDEYFGGRTPAAATSAPPSVGAQITSLPGYPENGPSLDSLDASLAKKSPKKIKELFDATAETHPELAEDLKKIYDQNYGSQAPSAPTGGQPLDPTEKAAPQPHSVHDPFSHGQPDLDAQPPAPPVWDSPAFAEEYKKIVGEGSASSVAQGTASGEKAKSKLDEMINNFPDSPQTEQMKVLRDKWFGKGMPLAPGQKPPAPSLTPAQVEEQLLVKLQAGSAGESWKTFKTPEFKQWFSGQQLTKQKMFAADPDLAQTAFEQDMLPPPEPAKPFKSQQLDPKDLAQWAQKKPTSEKEWKNFSAWWGNTKLSPAQEQKLYSTWFPGKHPSPEMAGQWFQSMFEHHAEPSEGDLGLAEGAPSWAHNSWAFGNKADKEWPVFQQWAANDPGLPKGSGVKAKLQIWNGLSADEKAEITTNYAKIPVDAGGVMGDLKKAYPDSDWGAWSKMPPGTLAKNVKMLAESGSYPPAIPIYNKYFGGDIPEIKEGPKGEEKPKPKAAKPSIPQSALPQWVKNGYGQFGGDTPAGAKKYTDFKQFADSLGQGKEAENPSLSWPSKLVAKYKKIPDPLKAQLAGMSKLPWDDEEGFTSWLAAQPTMKDEVKELYPNTENDDYGWNYSAGYHKKIVESYLNNETDPQKKQALLKIYHKYYGTGKLTLAEALKKAAPLPPKGAKDWDTYLQTHVPGDAAKLVKKQLKAEKDPDKFIQLADIWSKYFAGPPGHKQLGSALGKNHPGGKPLSVTTLQQLHEWKAEGGDPQSGLDYAQDVTSPYIEEAKAKVELGQTYPKFYGWTPPHDDATTDYTPDPAMLGSSGATTTYTAPQITQSKEYDQLKDSLSQYSPAMFSTKDKKTLNSEGFQNWFNKAPENYRKTMQRTPGLALDDFDNFMSGGPAYGHVPEGAGSKGKTKYIDVSPFAHTPKPGDKDVSGKKLPSSETHNPPKEKSIKFPRKPFEQEPLPLGAGEAWAPDYAAMPIYRGIEPNVMNLDSEPKLGMGQSHLNPKEKEHFLQMQRFRLRRIDELLNGPKAKRDPAKDLTHLKSWAKDNKISDSDMHQIADQMFSTQPTISQDDKWKHLQGFAQEHGLSEMAMYDLATNLGIGNPGQGVGGATGNWEHPELGQLVMDYLEGAGGLGTHWTRSKKKVYEGIPSAGYSSENSNPRQFPVAISGRWGGQGETPTNEGGAFDPLNASELEQNLKPGAPVHVHRVQIRSPDGDWHDVMNYGPMSLWPPGRDEGGGKIGDKPSLAQTLSDAVGIKVDKSNFDTLKPGTQAYTVFSKLVGEHKDELFDSQGKPNDKKKKLDKIYRDFFLGRPDLPMKPHHRRASVNPPLRTGGHQPEQLYDLAVRWGIPNPERYGVPPQRPPAPVPTPVVARKHGQHIVSANDSIWTGVS